MEQVELETEAPLYGGLCLSRHNGVVFVKGTIPGERVLAQLREQKRDYSIADAVEILHRSQDRVEARCPVFSVCGGCHYQHISYERQLAIKEEIVTDCLHRIGKTDIALGATLAGQQWHYRSKAQFKLSDDGTMGFYKEDSRDVVSVRECFICKNEINGLLRKLSGARFVRGIKEIHILTGENTIAYIKGTDMDEGRLDFFLDVGFDGAALEGGPSVGDTCCRFMLGQQSYTVSAQTFFQANWELNLRLIQLLSEALGDIEGMTILDAYGGAGNFSLPLSLHCRGATVIESNPHAIADGKRNIENNQLKNIKYISRPLEKLINAKAKEPGASDSGKEANKYDVVIVDPPRVGLTTVGISRLLALSPRRIAYVSCNPATFARDIHKLSQQYTLASVRLVDMFPNTYHCEVLGILNRR
ncbi:MAG: class I SAM-dependent RNA methyltransferase [Nitrospirae bacterium]|nr:class I SAM-dependent RNA methyltransferase [Nitrospirota bacterium]